MTNATQSSTVGGMIEVFATVIGLLVLLSVAVLFVKEEDHESKRKLFRESPHPPGLKEGKSEAWWDEETAKAPGEVDRL